MMVYKREEERRRRRRTEGVSSHLFTMTEESHLVARIRTNLVMPPIRKQSSHQKELGKISPPELGFQSRSKVPPDLFYTCINIIKYL